MNLFDYLIFIIVCIIYRLFQCLLNIVHFNFSLRFSHFVMSFCLLGRYFIYFYLTLFNFMSVLALVILLLQFKTSIISVKL